MADIPFVIIGRGSLSVLPEGMTVGVGSTVVSQLRKKNLTEYKTTEGYNIPTTVTITSIISKEKVIVRDIFKKEYETDVSKLEPVLYEENGFEFYATMQARVKSLESQLGGGSINNYYNKYINYKLKYINLRDKF